MKKINEMKSERATLIAKMETITKMDALTDEARAEFDGFEAEVTKLNADIERAEKQEKLNKIAAEKVEEVEDEREEVKPVGLEFRDWLKDAVEKGINSKFELRADPIITSTQAGLINKVVAPGLDILVSPGEAFLRTLGVSFFPGLTGNFVLNYVDQDTATFPGEDASAASADMAPGSLTLAARRVTHTQSITRETLAQTNPGVYSGIVQNLVNGIWNAVTNDVFDTLQTDAASQKTTLTAAGLTYGDLVMMEASIGGLNIGAGAYVTTPSVKAYLKQKVVLGTDNGPVWMDNQINGYPAYGVPAANANEVYFGDFGKMAVGQWGGIEIIVDPYSQAKQGRINLTAVALVDTGCFNPNGVVWADVSAGV